MTLGTRASYRVDLRGLEWGSMDVAVEGSARVRGGALEERDALLVRRWINSSSDGAREFVDAIDANTGALVWTSDVCAGADGACEDRIMVYYAPRGVAGLLGRPLLDGAVARGDAVPDEAGCVAVASLGPVTVKPSRQYIPTYPSAFPDGGSYRFCGSTPVPEAIAAPGEWAFRLEAVEPGAGEAIRVRYAAQAEPEVVPPEAKPWDGRHPPSPEWPSPFPMDEALAWLDENSEEYGAFLRANPDARLQVAKLDGSSGGRTREIPGVGSLNHSRTERRLVVVDAPSGDALAIELHKTRQTDFSSPDIEQASAEAVEADTAAPWATPPPRILSARDATSRVLSIIPGEWDDTQFMVLDRPFYRVLLRPHDSPIGGITVTRLDIGVVSAETGALEFAFGPHGSFFLT